MILDELPTLHQLPSLRPGLAESRQFGGCFVLGVQVFSALRDLYGRDGAETISGLCGTRVVLAAPDKDTSEWSAESLGRVEVEALSEGVSYETSRDGVTLSTRRDLRPLVLPAEVARLENLSGYLKFPGAWPVARIGLKYRDRDAMAARFEPKEEPEHGGWAGGATRRRRRPPKAPPLQAMAQPATALAVHRARSNPIRHRWRAGPAEGTAAPVEPNVETHAAGAPMPVDTIETRVDDAEAQEGAGIPEAEEWATGGETPLDASGDARNEPPRPSEEPAASTNVTDEHPESPSNENTGGKQGGGIREAGTEQAAGEDGKTRDSPGAAPVGSEDGRRSAAAGRADGGPRARRRLWI